jgi:hypothetical protein
LYSLAAVPESLSILIGPSVSGVGARPGYEACGAPTVEPGVPGCGLAYNITYSTYIIHIHHPT